LPEELANHVECCLLKPGKLLIFTDSSAWAAKLRFHQQTILAGLGEWLTP
jgi:predicted nucleic acid-binding Zn ribbon protein